MKTHSNSLMATFLSNAQVKPKICVVKLNGHSVRLQTDTASDITLISQRLWKTIGQSPVTSKRLLARSASKDSVHITGELPATIEIEDKTASGKIYLADSRQPFGTLFDRVTGPSRHATQFCLFDL